MDATELQLRRRISKLELRMERIIEILTELANEGEMKEWIQGKIYRIEDEEE